MQSQQEPASPFGRLLFYWSVAYIFVVFSFIHEIITLKTGLRTFLPSVFGIPSLFGLLISGGLRRSFEGRAAVYWLALAGWMVVTVPFSSWPGGSFTHVWEYFRTQFPILFVVAGMATSLRDLRVVLYAIAAAGVVNLLTARFLSIGEGRLQLELYTIGNSNDFAAQILMILPLFWFVSVSQQVPRVIRLLMYPAMLYGLYTCLQSGSRGALIGMVVASGIMLFFANGLQRVLILCAVPVVLVAILVMLPADLRERYSTLYSDEAQVGEAIASSQSRQYLLRRSIELTLHNPLFGVGIGQFSTAESEEVKSRTGSRGAWAETHNAYTQLSSEAGLPALALLLLGLGSAFLQLRQARRRASEARYTDLERMCFAILVSFILFSVSAVFLSMAYRFYFLVLTGLIIALGRITATELAQRRAVSGRRA